MERITLSDVVRESGGIYFGDMALLDAPVQNIVTDSRQVAAGTLFVAFCGERVDGHRFIASALADGALCAMGEQDRPERPYIKVASSERALGAIARWYRALFDIPLIGVTGSVGKTTCKEMIAAVLSQKYSVLKTEGNFNNALGVPLTLFRMTSQHQAAVVELGVSDFGEMRYLASIACPTAAVFTNIGDAHLEQFGDRYGVLRGKTELTEFLPNGAVIYLNGDDSLLCDYHPPYGLRKVTFGLTAGCDVHAELIAADEQGIACRVGDMELISSGGGQHLVYSILPAYAIGQEMGLSREQIVSGVASFAPLAGRGRLITTRCFRIIDHTYNANPCSMRAAIDALSELNGRKVAILGDMYELGDESPRLHREIGEYAAEKVDLLLPVGNLSIDMSHGAAENGNVHWSPDVEKLLEILPGLLEPGDNILVKASHSLHLEQVIEFLQRL